MKELLWKEIKDNTVARMEFHLQMMDEGIKALEDAGLDVVAKKLRNAHTMTVNDLNSRWIPTDMIPNKITVVVEHSNNEMSAEDVIKELQKIARENANIEI